MHPHSNPSPLRARCSGLWARFSASFDDVLLQAPDADAPSMPSSDCPDVDGLLRALGSLCLPGSPFVMASHPLAATAEQRARQMVWLQHELLRMDGTLHMQQLGGRWRQRQHRLAIKLREVMASPEAPPSGPWDCGLLKTDPAALGQAALFTPRRCTLMVAWEPTAHTLASLIAILQQREARFARPVRLWVLGGAVQA